MVVQIAKNTTDKLRLTQEFRGPKPASLADELARHIMESPRGSNVKPTGEDAEANGRRP
ncbi:MAG: hypothetical protein ABSG86_29455 [Thermoguttaceae bacterium]|jgi:hypothetical protein